MRPGSRTKTAVGAGGLTGGKAMRGFGGDRGSEGRARGFSTLEFGIAIAAIVLLAGILVPISRDSARDGRAAEILGLYDEVASAAQALYADTGRLPLELGTSVDPRAARCRVSPQHPKNRAMLLDRTDAPVYATGPFDLLGTGAPTEGSASVLVLASVPAELARRLDATIDRGIPGAWDRTGRVKYADRDLQMFVFAPPATVKGTAPPAGDRPEGWERGSPPRPAAEKPKSP